MEYESFIGTVREAGNGSLEITIPHKLVKFMGLNAGNHVKIMVKKVELKEDN